MRFLVTGALVYSHDRQLAEELQLVVHSVVRFLVTGASKYSHDRQLAEELQLLFILWCNSW